MQRLSFPVGGWLLGGLLSLAVFAQEPPSNSSPSKQSLPVFTSAREAVAMVTERGPHHRVEQWVERIIGEDGASNDVTHSYTVLANGLHYLDGGEWKETVPEFVPVEGGWLAGRGPHQVLVSDDLFVAGAVTVVAAEGATWKSTPMTLALRDRAKGEVLVLGESRATRGEQVAANMILFRDAFDGPVPADVRVIYTAAGVECDVILRSGLPLSATLGADPAQCDLVVQTEVFEGGPTALRERQRTVNKPADGQPDAAQKVPEFRADAVLELGTLRMEDGKAFGTLADPTAEPGHSVPVYKRYYQDEATQRLFLEESTPLDSLQALLEPLPEASLPGAWEARWRDTALNKTGARKSGVAGTLRPAPVLPRRNDGRFETADADPLSIPALSRGFPVASIASQPTGGLVTVPGVVLDWSYATSANNFTFRSGTTYYVTSLVQLGGTGVVFEPNCVIKFAGDTTSGLQVNSGAAVTWLGEPYLPVTLTGKDDNTIGETITGSSGSPGRYGGTYLFINAPTSAAMIRNSKFRYARTAFAAINAFGNNRVTVRHAQFTDCDSVFRFQNGGSPNTTYFVENVLVVNAGTLFKDLYYSPVQAMFITADIVGTFRQSAYNPDYSTVKVFNSVLANVGGLVASDFFGACGADVSSAPNSTVISPANAAQITGSTAGYFATSGAGSHYLAKPGVPTTAAGQWLLGVTGCDPIQSIFGEDEPAAALLVSDPPELLALSGGSGVLSPKPIEQDARPGYHYWRMDHLVDNATVSGPLLLSNGVVVGMTGTKAFQLNAGGSFASGGSPASPNRLVRVSLVQEGTAGLTGTTFTVFGLGTGSQRPTIDVRFTEFLLPTGPGRTFAYDTGSALASLTVRDCRWAGGSIYLLPPVNSASQTVYMVNNIFEAADLGFHHYYDSNFGVTFRNNLVRRGNLLIYYASQVADTQHPTWTLKDNLFDSAALQLTTVAYGNYYVAAGYNGYTVGTSNPFGGTGNKTNLSADFAEGPLGKYYYPDTGAAPSLASLRNVGSAPANQVGLYHYTTDKRPAPADNDQTLTDERQVFKELNSTVDIGFHYVAASSSGLPLDSDLRELRKDHDQNASTPKVFDKYAPYPDGIPDYLEDRNGDGGWTVSTPPNAAIDETDWRTDESDRSFDAGTGDWVYDGVPDNQELQFGSNPFLQDSDGTGGNDGAERALGSDPLLNSGTATLLQEWNFGAAGAPSSASDSAYSADPAVVFNTGNSEDPLFDGPAAKFTAGTTGVLKYPVANCFRPLHGTLRFIYVPQWYLGNPGDQPGIECRLFECGEWSLSVSVNGRALIFRVPKSGGGTRTPFITSLPRDDGQNLSHRRAYEIELNWTRGGVWMRINGVDSPNQWVNGAGAGDGGGTEANPSSSYLVFGSDGTGGLRAQGWLDQVQTFNAVAHGPYSPLWSLLRIGQERREHFISAIAEAGGLRLRWLRGWEGDPSPGKAEGNYKVERRELSGNAGAPGAWELVANVFDNTKLDPVVTSGTGGIREGKRFEYRVNRNGKPAVTTVAAWRGEATDRHGKAILIVDETVVDTAKPQHIATELANYTQELIRDGWEVVQHNVPRHQDMAYPTPNCTDYQNVRIPANKLNAATVKGVIQGALAANDVNVVFLIGHVTIPYSGTGSTEDGHSSYLGSNDPGHQGAWPADSWYGSFSGSWEDTAINLPNDPHWEWCWNRNVPNDGRWERGLLPAPLDVPIGRIDFHLMATFKTASETMDNTQDDTEIRLLKQYLDKASRYRRGLLTPTGDFRVWDGIGRAQTTARRLTARRWGVDLTDPGRMDDDAFLPGTTALWAAHTDYGHWNQIGTIYSATNPHRHLATEVANPAFSEFPRAMFLLLSGSYMGEWFRRDDDFMRTCLAVPDTALFVSWIDRNMVFRTDRFHAGYPLYSVLKDTFDANPSASCRTTVLLGDPYLRESYIAPVNSATASKPNNGTVEVSWPLQSAATAGYRIYRAPSTTSGTWTWVGDAIAGAAIWTDPAPGTGANAYLVKTKALQSDGTGSHHVLGLGVISNLVSPPY